ncbi:MAG: RIP metalloprotease [Actinomycetota bacterium]|nr:M50 family metallopeptidase [Actinomycetota bacterium]
MSGAVGIIAFIVAITVMTFVHEMGHFLTARRFGMKVDEFFIGFGPKLFSRRLRSKRHDDAVRTGGLAGAHEGAAADAVSADSGTEFGVRLLLFGGYVKIAGMNPWQEIPPEDFPHTFKAKPSWQRAIVLAAGSMTHFVLGALIFMFLYGVLGVPNFDKPTTTVESVDVTINGKQGPAKEAGLRAGDKIVAVDRQEVRTWDAVRKGIRSSDGAPIDLEVLRDNRSVHIRVTPVLADAVVDPKQPSRTEKVSQVGVVPSFALDKQPPVKAVWLGVETTGVAVYRSVLGMGQAFSPHGLSKVFASLGSRGPSPKDRPLGLVGIARVSGQAASTGHIQDLLLILAGFIVFVGVINLAPLPPLDGGYLLILAIEKVFRRKVDMRKVVPVAGLVLGFFVVLTVALLYLDIVKPIANPLQ